MAWEVRLGGWRWVLTLVLGSNCPGLGKYINHFGFLEAEFAASGFLGGSRQGRTEWSSKLRVGGGISAS